MTIDTLFKQSISVLNVFFITRVDPRIGNIIIVGCKGYVI